MTPASRYVTSASRYQSRSSMYIRGMISRISTELAKTVPIGSGNELASCIFVCQCELKKVRYSNHCGPPCLYL